MSAQRKITSLHLERLAVVYLRQSTPAQVRLNVRSTERQYAIAGEAARFGWESERIVVVDGDLGVGPRHPRAGELQAAGRQGVFGRGRRDLRPGGLEGRLEQRGPPAASASTCALTDTLVLDTDGIYDLQDFNDRLLLGLKAQMSEAELHIMAGRLQGAKRAAAERGELRFGLPVGYVYDEEGQTIIDPDQEVQAAIADVFAAFLQTGSAMGRSARSRRRFPKRAWGGRVGGRVAVGRSRPAGRANASEPVLRRGVRVGRCRSRRVVRPDGDDRHHDGRAAPLGVGGAHPRPSPCAHQLGIRTSLTSSALPRSTRARVSDLRARAQRWPGDRALRRVRACDERAIPRQGCAL